MATTELANVQTQYQRRADMMPQLAKIVKAYAKHEKETFAEVTKARAAVGQVKLDANNLTEASLKKYAAAQGELANAFSKLMVVAEKYPELRAGQPGCDGCDQPDAVGGQPADSGGQPGRQLCGDPVWPGPQGG